MVTDDGGAGWQWMVMAMAAMVMAYYMVYSVMLFFRFTTMAPIFEIVTRLTLY